MYRTLSYLLVWSLLVLTVFAALGGLSDSLSTKEGPFYEFKIRDAELLGFKFDINADDSHDTNTVKFKVDLRIPSRRFQYSASFYSLEGTTFTQLTSKSIDLGEPESEGLGRVWHFTVPKATLTSPDLCLVFSSPAKQGGDSAGHVFIRLKDYVPKHPEKN